MRQRGLLNAEPREDCTYGDEYEDEAYGRPGMNGEEACGDDELDDGPMQDVRAVGEVSPAGGAFDMRHEEASAEDEDADGGGTEEEPVRPDVQTVREDGEDGQQLAVFSEEVEVVEDERADQEEGELTGELDDKLLMTSEQDAEQDRCD